MPRRASRCAGVPPIGGAVEHDAAAVRRIEAGDDVDAGGLAGPVGADEAEHLAGGELQADAVERAEAAEAFHNVFDAEQRAQGTRMPRRVNSETRPFGRNITSATISRP